MQFRKLTVGKEAYLSLVSIKSRGLSYHFSRNMTKEMKNQQHLLGNIMQRLHRFLIFSKLFMLL